MKIYYAAMKLGYAREYNKGLLVQSQKQAAVVS
jgi:hypothetical protein